jgi:hypothetical protein
MNLVAGIKASAIGKKEEKPRQAACERAGGYGDFSA